MLIYLRGLEEPLALRKPYASIAIIFMISVSLCKAPRKTVKLAEASGALLLACEPRGVSAAPGF